MPGDGDRVVKSDIDSGVFTSDDFYCFDPLADVALAAVSAHEEGAAERLRHAYEEAARKPVDAELSTGPRGFLPAAAGAIGAHTDRRPDCLLQRYYGETLLGDAQDAINGPMCGIDVDGVLETMSLGLSATSPMGAMSLRTLGRHGFRPVLATGRSLGEVRERCLAYGLAGGVAEYGAVVYDRAWDESEVMVDGVAQAALDSLRDALRQTPDVCIDPGYLHVVRAFRIDRDGRRRGLSRSAAEEALAKASCTDSVRTFQGFYQTGLRSGFDT